MSAELLELALAAARPAGELLLARAGGPASGLAAKTSSTDLVSDTDRAAEALIIATIRAARPGDAIVAEEGGGGAGASGVRWLIDPLDGTINYLWGVPQWSVSIAALDGDGLLVGVVHDPSAARRSRASAARGARLGDAARACAGRPAVRGADRHRLRLPRRASARARRAC